MISSARILIAIIFIFSISRHYSDANEYCVADVQATEEMLQEALGWACRHGADCTAIQPNQPCFQPNTTMHHASYAFNSYYQKMKHRNGSCYFNAAALLDARNPSRDSCKFDLVA